MNSPKQRLDLDAKTSKNKNKKEGLGLPETASDAELDEVRYGTAKRVLASVFGLSKEAAASAVKSAPSSLKRVLREMSDPLPKNYFSTTSAEVSRSAVGLPPTATDAELAKALEEAIKKEKRRKN